MEVAQLDLVVVDFGLCVYDPTERFKLAVVGGFRMITISQLNAEIEVNCLSTR